MPNAGRSKSTPGAEPVAWRAVTPLARLLQMPIRLYRALRAGRPTPCRFLPTCSAYALEALETHGALRGSALAVRRIGRCRPGGGHGVDLVPEPRRGRR